MESKLKKFHFANRIFFTSLPPSNSCIFFIQIIFSQVSEICLLTRAVGFLESEGSAISHFSFLSSPWPKPFYLFWKRKQCHFIPCMRNSKVPERIFSNFLLTHLWAETHLWAKRKVWTPKDNFSEKLGTGRGKVGWWNSSDSCHLPSSRLWSHSSLSPGDALLFSPLNNVSSSSLPSPRLLVLRDEAKALNL